MGSFDETRPIRSLACGGVKSFIPQPNRVVLFRYAAPVSFGALGFAHRGSAPRGGPAVTGLASRDGASRPEHDHHNDAPEVARTPRRLANRQLPTCNATPTACNATVLQRERTAATSTSAKQPTAICISSDRAAPAGTLETLGAAPASV